MGVAQHNEPGKALKRERGDLTTDYTDCTDGEEGGDAGPRTRTRTTKKKGKGGGFLALAKTPWALMGVARDNEPGKVLKRERGDLTADYTDCTDGEEEGGDAGSRTR